MIVTTTNNIEGHTIRKYIGVVNANVVIGTNLFSDFAASLTDVFGGRSGNYKNKLTTIYGEVMKELTDKASSCQADAILGLHIDFDEISGGGKSMFMVSASGTAVTLEKNTEERYSMYDLIDRIIRYKERGILTDEEFEYEKNRILNQNRNPISDEYKKISDEKEIKKNKEIQQEKKINEAKNFLEKSIGCSINDIENINEYKIQFVSYDDIPYDVSDSMEYVIAKFIRMNRIAEACKFYIDETGLNDIQSAIDFCITIYKRIKSVDPTKITALIPKLKELKEHGLVEQAIFEYQKIAFVDKKTAESFILSL